MTALGKLFRATAFRLTLAIVALSAIGAALALGFVGRQVHSVVEEQIRRTIEAEATGLAEQYAEGGVVRLSEAILSRAAMPGASLFLLANKAGETVAGNITELPDGVLDKPGFIETPYEAVDEDRLARHALAHVFILSEGYRLLVGRDLRDDRRIEATLVRALATSLAFFAVLGGLGALFVARRVLGRIDAMNVTARAIMAGDLESRLPVSGSGDEIDRLAVGLNAMLARIAELMTGLREISDNVAHDLRTPLTRLRNHVEAALRAERDPQGDRTALEGVLEEADGLIRVFNALLLIARAEAGADRTGMSEFDVGQAVRDVAELYAPAAEDKDVQLKVDAPRGLRLLGNRELIGQTIANLIDNSLKYAAAENDSKPQIVEVEARRTGAAAEIIIADRGPGIAPEDRARVLERFVRLEGARSRPGSGLGLSLAAAVARLHGGSVRLEDNAPGLRVVLTLPALAV